MNKFFSLMTITLLLSAHFLWAEEAFPAPLDSIDLAPSVDSTATGESKIQTIRLTIEKAVELATVDSFDAIEKKFDLKLNKIDELKHWYSYIPKLIYSADLKKDQAYSELGPSFVDDSLDVNETLAFQQKLFGSDLITIINENKISEMGRDIIETEFTAELRYYVRNIYAAILVKQIKLEYVNELLAIFPKGNVESSDIFDLGDSEMRLSLEETALAVESSIARYKRSLLAYLRLSYIDDCILVSSLEEVEADIQNDYASARKNSIRIKLIEQDILTAKTQLTQGITGFLPQVSLNYDYNFYNDLNMNVSLDLDKNGFGAYVGVERNSDVLDGEPVPISPDPGINGALSGSVSFDSRQIFDAATDTAKSKVNLEKVKLRRQIEEEELFQKLREQLIVVEKEQQSLDFSRRKVMVFAGKRKAFEKMVEPTADSGWWFFQQYEETTDKLISQVNNYFAAYQRHYQNINYYYYIVDGGTSPTP